LLFLQVPLGDRQARLELNKKNPDVNIAGEGFIKGENSPEDVNDLIFLYRRFRHLSYMDIAIQDWTNGDAGIADLIQAGNKIHTIVIESVPKNDLLGQEVKNAEIASLTQDVYTIDTKLTILENHFSATLGEGSRRIRDNLLLLFILLSIVLGAAALFIAISIEDIVVRVDKAKSEFVSLTSHQLRTPLTTINWYIELLMKRGLEGLDNKQKEYIAQTYQASKRMVDLTNKLLIVSRIELGKIVINSQDVDLKKTIEQILTELKSQITIKNLHVIESYPKNQKYLIIKSDPKLIYIILQNIISNAIKYSFQDGEIKITVTKENAKNIAIELSDAGYGIPEKEQSKIFAKFYRASNIAMIDQRGAGLGLYIVKSIINLLGGAITLVSKKDNGTIVKLILPNANTGKNK
jgi:signal transduction histidine kinase